MIDQNSYFNRQIQLWGEETQTSLKNKSIAIIGAGGLGCSLALALGTSGIGQVDMVDFDTVGIHNIHRQIAFKISDEGRYKAEVVSELLIAKNPFVTTQALVMDFEQFATLNPSYDLILDATDNLPVREAIDHYSKKHQIPWIYASVEEFNGQVCFFENSSFGIFNHTQHQVGGNIAPMVMHIASLQATLALRYLAGLKIQKERLHYLYFNSEGELITQKFSMPR
jgi:adenylyltransferase/sulfurtransferase